MQYINFKQLGLCKLTHLGLLLVTVFLAGCAGLNSFPDSSRIDILTPITDYPTNTYYPGKFVWVDLVTPDVASAKTFYGGLFGWSFVDKGGYTLISNNGIRIAGIVEVIAKPGEKADALWLTAMSVTNVDEAAAFVEAEGGTVLKGPVTMVDRGRGALVSDPQGAQLILLHAIGGDPSDSTQEIGDWIWNEIWSNEPHKTSTFYKELGKYDSTPVGDAYEILTSNTQWRAGIRYISIESYQARWVPAIRVDDPVKILEKVEQLGGTILLRPDEAPSNGDTALISGPSGALLMLQRWSDEETEEAY